jgi:hypothetical protein
MYAIDLRSGGCGSAGIRDHVYVLLAVLATKAESIFVTLGLASGSTRIPIDGFL